MSAVPQFVNARELVVGGRGYGWSAMAWTLLNDSEVELAVGSGPTREGGHR